VNNTRAFELVRIALRHANRLGVYEDQDCTIEFCHEHTLFFNAIRKGEYRELLDWINTLDEKKG
jgi:hypothetical protein